MRPHERADAVTCIRLDDPPPGVDGNDVVRVAREDFDVTIGAGVGEMWGRAFRIGHMGDLNASMILGALALPLTPPLMPRHMCYGPFICRFE